METISLTIAALGVITSIYFSQKNINKRDRENREQYEQTRHERQKELIEKAEKDAERHATIMATLHNLVDGTKANSRDISELKDEIKSLSETQVANSRDLKTAFNRIDKVEQRLEKLHQEHRNNMSRCSKKGV